MKPQSFEKLAKQYLERYAFCPPKLTSPLAPNTNFVVVIPVHNEPDLLTTFRSLAACQAPKSKVEVIALINAGENASENVRLQNEQTYETANNWLKTYQSDWLSFQLLRVENLPKKHAGVGLARKIGMDEAVFRLQQQEQNGVIVCLDADCEVKSDYFLALEACFDGKPQHKLASIYYEHPLEELEEPLQTGIVYYEFALRYYVQALKYVGYPAAVHTVGSSMAVRADAYCLAGGMNRRKAAEDFYFLHKIAQVRGCEEITTTCVYPSGRVSERVPFGTGKAQQKWLEQPKPTTYDFQTFRDLKAFFEKVPLFFELPKENIAQIFETFPKSIQQFVPQAEFESKLLEIQRHSSSLNVFRQRFFVWWNGLKVLKFVHFARDYFYPDVKSEKAAESLLTHIHSPFPKQTTIQNYLDVFRALDKKIKA